MTKRQQRSVQRYVDSVKPMLGLTDWEVVVKPDYPYNENHDGAHRSIPGVRTSLLRFSEGFFDFEPSYQREIVVHELLHAVFAPEQDQVRHILPDYLTGKAGEIFRDVWFQAHEYAIDQLATALSPFFPPPPEFPR